MQIKELSTCFCTDKIDLCREFYIRHFGAKLTFDCGWYINLTIGDSGLSLQFMEPQDDSALYKEEGVVLNFNVDDVDTEYQRLTAEGLTLVMPLEDHPWGDRGFAVMDPLGNSLYIYSEREPSEEFKKFYVQ